jgi:hypothetical protein
MSSFPVPVSPSMRTVESVEATCSTSSRTDSRAALLPMIRLNLRSGGSASEYVPIAYSGTRNLLSYEGIVVAVSLTDQVLLGSFRATVDDPKVSPGIRLRPLSSLESARMIGILHCSALSLACSSKPEIPGICISAIDTRLHGANRFQGILPPIQSTEPQIQQTRGDSEVIVDTTHPHQSSQSTLDVCSTAGCAFALAYYVAPNSFLPALSLVIHSRM